MKKSTRSSSKNVQKDSSPDPVADPTNKRTRSADKKQDDPKPLKKTKVDNAPSKSKSKSKMPMQSEQSEKDESPVVQKKKTSRSDKQKNDNSATDNKEQAKKAPNKEEAKPQKEELKKMILKGKIPVDPHFPRLTQARVLTENEVTYAATLNQSNIANNNNKFYIIQVLEIQKSPNTYYFFSRWGRVGVVGQMASIGPCGKDAAISNYLSKLKDKTRSGQYRVVEMNYDADNKEEEEKSKQIKNKEPQVKSQLKPEVQELIKLIFDMKMMDRQMKQIGYDSKKMPLGKLAKSSILKGYESLKGLMDQVKGKNRKDVIEKLSSDFYSDIPHDFGFSKMSNHVLDTDRKIKLKLQMLQSLEDIQIFTKLLDEGKISNDMNDLDSNYLKLSTQIEPLDKKSPTYQILIDYVKNTHAETHNNYHIEVEEIFQIKKDNEHVRFTNHIGNNQLLWHGSRLTNFVGILSQGLRIAPPEAPVTGYMFGKGVYFADMVSKSANYCFTNKLNNTGLMLLCEVALGDMNQKKHADYYANLLPAGKSSTKGLGKNAPDGGVKWQNMFVPNGKGKPTGIYDTSLLYNEFIVYDVAQIKCRFLFRMKFHHKY